MTVEELYKYYKKNGVKGLFVKPTLEVVKSLQPINIDEYDEMMTLVEGIDAEYEKTHKVDICCLKLDLTKTKKQAYILVHLQTELPVLIYITKKCQAYVYYRKLEKDKPAEKRKKAKKLRKYLKTNKKSF